MSRAGNKETGLVSGNHGVHRGKAPERGSVYGQLGREQQRMAALFKADPLFLQKSEQGCGVCAFM